jgi:RNA polymerase sigma factor for flagellar operon FliA
MKPAKSIAPAAVQHVPTAAEITELMPLVHQSVARFVRRLPPSVLKDDLVAAGTFGLVDALRKGGADRGPAFEWYARVRIRGAILDELRSQDWLTRRARAKAGDRPTSVIGFDDMPDGQEGALADAAAPAPDAAITASMEHAALAEAVEGLPERERFIVQSHYFKGIPFKQIAAELKVSEPRISQLHARAMQMLRGKMKAGENAA